MVESLRPMGSNSSSRWFFEIDREKTIDVVSGFNRTTRRVRLQPDFALCSGSSRTSRSVRLQPDRATFWEALYARGGGESGGACRSSAVCSRSGRRSPVSIELTVVTKPGITPTGPIKEATSASSGSSALRTEHAVDDEEDEVEEWRCIGQTPLPGCSQVHSSACDALGVAAHNATGTATVTSSCMTSQLAATRRTCRRAVRTGLG